MSLLLSNTLYKPGRINTIRLSAARLLSDQKSTSHVLLAATERIHSSPCRCTRGWRPWAPHRYAQQPALRCNPLTLQSIQLGSCWIRCPHPRSQSRTTRPMPSICRREHCSVQENGHIVQNWPSGSLRGTGGCCCQRVAYH